MSLAMQPLLEAIEKKNKQNLFLQLRPTTQKNLSPLKDMRPLYMDSYDYLNIASLPLAKKNAIENVVKWGTGSTPSRPLLAHLKENIATEEKYKKALNYETCSLFSFTADIHTQLFSSLLGCKARILIDTDLYPFIKSLHHSDHIHQFHTIDALEDKLKQCSSEQTTLIAISSGRAPQPNCSPCS